MNSNCKGRAAPLRAHQGISSRCTNQCMAARGALRQAHGRAASAGAGMRAGRRWGHGESDGGEDGLARGAAGRPSASAVERAAPRTCIQAREGEGPVLKRQPKAKREMRALRRAQPPYLRMERGAVRGAGGASGAGAARGRRAPPVRASGRARHPCHPLAWQERPRVLGPRVE